MRPLALVLVLAIAGCATQHTAMEDKLYSRPTLTKCEAWAAAGFPRVDVDPCEGRVRFTARPSAGYDPAAVNRLLDVIEAIGKRR